MREKNNTPAECGGKTLCQSTKTDKNYNIPKNAPKRIVALCYFLQRSMYKLEALELYGETCLNTTVSELSKQGYEFDRKRERHQGRCGKPITYMRYWLMPHCHKQAEKELGEYHTTLEA